MIGPQKSLSAFICTMNNIFLNYYGITLKPFSITLKPFMKKANDNPRVGRVVS